VAAEVVVCWVARLRWPSVLRDVNWALALALSRLWTGRRPELTIGAQSGSSASLICLLVSGVGIETDGERERERVGADGKGGLGICSYCCPCAVVGRTFATVSGKPCEAHCCSLCCICFVGMCYVVAYRTKIREKYNLKGSRGLDCILTCCCALCTICQEAREVQKREASFPKPFGEKAEEPGYQSMAK